MNILSKLKDIDAPMMEEEFEDKEQPLDEMEDIMETCVRKGCVNPPIENPNWEGEYCSSECAVSHCKETFKNWVHERLNAAANIENHNETN